MDMDTKKLFQITEAAHACSLSRSTLLRLEERGLLTGEYYGTDRRTIHLKLTDAASPMVSDGKNVQKRAAEIICRGFTPEEHRMLFELMNRINSNISDYRKEGKLHEQQ